MANKSDTRITDLSEQVETASAPVTPSPVAAVELAAADDALSGKKVKLRIHSSESEMDGSEAVPLQINGYLYQIPRDTDVIVPEEVYLQLQNCVTVRLTQKSGEQIEKRVPRFAISFFGQVGA